MEIESFVREIRKEYIDDLTEGYANVLDTTDISKYSDKKMLALASLWLSSSNEAREVLKQFIRLGAQNSIASLFGLIDNVSSIEGFDGDLSLVGEYSNGIKQELGGDLLDTFWEQEELDGEVND
mgnify:CR=1 FL=1